MYGIYNRCLKKNFAKAEFKNFISEKEKNRKTRIKNFKKKIWLSRSKYLSLHGTFNNFHIILNFVFCIHTAVVVRCWRFFFMRACACVRVRKQKMVEVDGFSVDITV